METVDARILVIDDDPDILVAAKVVLRQRFRVVEGLQDPGQLAAFLSAETFDLILLDMNFSLGKTSGREGLKYLKEILVLAPGQPVIVVTAYASIDLAVEAMKLGAYDFVVKPWDNEKLEVTVLAALERARQKPSRHDEMASDVLSAWFETTEPSMGQVKELIEKISPTDATVLLLGETGTGKEVTARQIHQKSHRSKGPFVKVDLGAVHPNLFESELFGHKKGAFTDAREDKTGKMALADQGTLFLDEIANLPLILQSKLLSALQQLQVTPVGSNTPVKTRFRLIAATNKDIYRLTQTGEFREDLLWRINTVEIKIPPLRERYGDLAHLAKLFTDHYAGKYGRAGVTIPQEVIDHLKEYHWPGNIRELQNVIERAVILSEGKLLRTRDFVLKGSEEVKEAPTSMEEVERTAIEKALKKHKGNMRQAAIELGLSRSTLYRKVQRYGL